MKTKINKTSWYDIFEMEYEKKIPRIEKEEDGILLYCDTLRYNDYHIIFDYKIFTPDIEKFLVKHFVDRIKYANISGEHVWRVVS